VNSTQSNLRWPHNRRCWRPNAEVLQDVFSERHLTPCGNGRCAHGDALADLERRQWKSHWLRAAPRIHPSCSFFGAAKR